MLKAEHLTRHNKEISSRSSPERVTVDWVATNFEAVVRLGTGAEKQDYVFAQPRQFQQALISDRELSQMHSIWSNELVEPNPDLVAELRQRVSTNGTLKIRRKDSALQMLSIMTDTFFRRGSLETMGQSTLNQMYRRLQNWNMNGGRLRIVVPTLPFKDQTPVTTGQPIGQIDLGEMIFLQRLDLLARSVSAVSGLVPTIQVVTDGHVYSDIFIEGETQAAMQYHQACQDYVSNHLMAVELTDLSDVVADTLSFESVQSQIKEYLLKLIGSPALDHAWQALQRGMLYNTALSEPFDNYQQFIKNVQRPLSELQDDYPATMDQLQYSAVEYASFLLTMRATHALDNFFLDAPMIRATVHPKAGQLGLKTLGSGVAPYNGVTLINQKALEADYRLQGDWYTCERLAQLYLRHPENIHQLINSQEQTMGYIFDEKV